VFLVALLFSPMAGVPTGGEGVSLPGTAGQSAPARDADAPRELIGQAEALLAVSPDDPATLQFAAEAYRLARRRAPAETALDGRLDELEARLRKVTADRPTRSPPPAPEIQTE